jgi:hypothetical protein
MSKQFKATTKLTAKFLVVLMVLQAALFALTAFGAEPTSLEIKLGGQSISAPVKMYTGTRLSFTGVFTPTDSTYHVTWNRTGTAVDVISTTGVVTAGTTGGGVSSTLSVTPTKGSLTATPVTILVYKALATFTFPSTGQTINLGQTTQISQGTQTPGADVTSTTYAFVDAAKGAAVLTLNTVTGEVYAKAPGTVQVKVTKVLPIGANKVATITIKVPEPVASLDISTDGKNAAGTNLGINSGKKTTLKTILTTSTGGRTVPTNKVVKWEKVSGDTEITINETTGVISLVNNTDALIGKTAVIKATANDTWNSAADTITVTVGKELKALTVTKSVYLLKKDDVKQIIPVLTSTTVGVAPTVTSITYTIASADTAKVTVDAAGHITAVAVGDGKPVKVTVTALAADGTKKSTFVNVTVVADVTSITLVSPTVTVAKALKLYSKATIRTTIAPSGLKLNAVRYTSANPAIAFVNPYTGEVTAMGVGSTTVSASGDGVPSNVITIYVADPDGLQQ